MQDNVSGWRSRVRPGALIACAALAFAACSEERAMEPTTDTLVPTSPGDHGAPAGGQQRKAGMEINYMEFTIDHHGMGIMVAQLCVEKATHAELRELCQRNIQAQTTELAQLQTWLGDWYGISYDPRMTRGDERMMERLAALEGSEFEIEFMEMFSRHHHQIVQRSRPIAQQAVHAELRQLADTIVQAQTTDIRLMLTWLCTWYDICHPRFGSAPG
jgi:uncharacterized protein (DUF305 family)